VQKNNTENQYRKEENKNHLQSHHLDLATIVIWLALSTLSFPPTWHHFNSISFNLLELGAVSLSFPV
jgi:hypothetical protein